MQALTTLLWFALSKIVIFFSSVEFFNSFFLADFLSKPKYFQCFQTKFINIFYFSIATYDYDEYTNGENSSYYDDSTTSLANTASTISYSPTLLFSTPNHANVKNITTSKKLSTPPFNRLQTILRKRMQRERIRQLAKRRAKRIKLRKQNQLLRQFMSGNVKSISRHF